MGWLDVVGVEIGVWMTVGESSLQQKVSGCEGSFWFVVVRMLAEGGVLDWWEGWRS